MNTKSIRRGIGFDGIGERKLDSTPGRIVMKFSAGKSESKHAESKYSDFMLLDIGPGELLDIKRELKKIYKWSISRKNLKVSFNLYYYFHMNGVEIIKFIAKQNIAYILNLGSISSYFKGSKKKLI